MATHSDRWLFDWFPPRIAWSLTTAGPHERRRWLFERALVRGRWCALAVAIALLPVVDGGRRPALAGLLVALAAGNIVVTRLLEDGPGASAFQRARRLATAVEWAGALAAIALRAAEPRAATPALLLLLLAIVGARHRLRGLALATVGAWLAVALLALAQARVYDALSPGAARSAALEWAALLALMALVVVALIAVNDEERRVTDVRHAADLGVLRARHATEASALAARHAAELDAYRRERAGLTPREWQLLPLLAEGLSNEQAAMRLAVEVETVKKYVQRLNRKLGVHSREAIVALARERGWLDDQPRRAAPSD